MTNYVGIRIKELLQLSEMYQEELGRRVGVQRAAIQKYEKGTVQNVPLPTIEKIARVFDVSPNYLVGWDNSTTNLLSAETKTLKAVQYFYGKESVELLEVFTTLSKVGKTRVIQYAEDMAEIHKE